MDVFRIFDDDEDGQIHAADLVEVLTNLGEKLTKSEARKMVQKADKGDGGLIDYPGKVNGRLNEDGNWWFSRKMILLSIIWQNVDM